MVKGVLGERRLERLNAYARAHEIDIAEAIRRAVDFMLAPGAVNQPTPIAKSSDIPMEADRALAAWKPGKGVSANMPLENYEAAIKCLFYDAGAAPPWKVLNRWGRMLVPAGDIGYARWALVAFLTELHNRGALGKPQSYLYAAVRNEAARRAEETRELIAADIAMGGVELPVQ